MKELEIFTTVSIVRDYVDWFVHGDECVFCFVPIQDKEVAWHVTMIGRDALGCDALVVNGFVCTDACAGKFLAERDITITLKKLYFDKWSKAGPFCAVCGNTPDGTDGVSQRVITPDGDEALFRLCSTACLAKLAVSRPPAWPLVTLERGDTIIAPQC